MAEDQTLPEETRAARRATAPGEALALVVAWCAGSHERVGEVLLLPAGDPGPPRIFGRGPASPSDPQPRVLLVRERAGSIDATPPLELPHVSRRQLLLRARGSEGILVEGIGRCTTEPASAPGSPVLVRPGACVALGRQLLFVCARRPDWSGPAFTPGPPFPFGTADAGGVVGESPAAWTLRRSVAFAGAAQGHVLVSGPSGAGKELTARAIHAASQGAHGPFVARSAATIPDALIDAELFGNARGYPHAGLPERPGLVGLSHGGTLFLDEFAELSASLQAHLLRVLDAGEYHRLGEGSPRVANFRLVAATNRGLSSLKDDILARFSLRVEVPGLEARREDIPLLLGHVLRRLATAGRTPARRFFDGSPDVGTPRLSLELVRGAVESVLPGNVRDLERWLLRAIEHATGDVLDAPPSPDAAGAVAHEAPETSLDDPALGLTAERVQVCLDAHNGAIEPTWRELGLRNRHAFSRLAAKLGVEIRKRPRAR